jgi:hypothetical protein
VRFAEGANMSSGAWVDKSRRRFVAILATSIVVPCISPKKAQGQQLLQFDRSRACSFYGEKIVDDVYTFSSSAEAQAVMKRITDHVGLPANFVVMAANVPNAMAVIRGTQRIIAYSEVFINSINQRTGDYWASWTILAHEVGHHLAGHTLDSAGSRPPIELEADQFAGFVSGRMGASLSQATIAFQQMPESGGATHPPRSARLEAATVGWRRATSEPARPQPAPPTEQSPPPPVVSGTAEGHLRKMISGLRNGTPDYSQIDPQIVPAIAQQVPMVKDVLQQAGEITQIRPASSPVTHASGAVQHEFVVAFQRARLLWRIIIDPTGRIVGLWFQQG